MRPNLPTTVCAALLLVFVTLPGAEAQRELPVGSVHTFLAPECTVNVSGSEDQQTSRLGVRFLAVATGGLTESQTWKVVTIVDWIDAASETGQSLFEFLFTVPAGEADTVEPQEPYCGEWQDCTAHSELWYLDGVEWRRSGPTAGGVSCADSPPIPGEECLTDILLCLQPPTGTVVAKAFVGWTATCTGTIKYAQHYEQVNREAGAAAGPVSVVAGDSVTVAGDYGVIWQYNCKLQGLAGGECKGGVAQTCETIPYFEGAPEQSLEPCTYTGLPNDTGCKIPMTVVVAWDDAYGGSGFAELGQEYPQTKYICWKSGYSAETTNTGYGGTAAGSDNDAPCHDVGIDYKVVNAARDVCEELEPIATQLSVGDPPAGCNW